MHFCAPDPLDGFPKLETQLAQSREKAEKLLEALVAELTGEKGETAGVVRDTLNADGQVKLGKKAGKRVAKK